MYSRIVRKFQYVQLNSLCIFVVKFSYFNALDLKGETNVQKKKIPKHICNTGDVCIYVIIQGVLRAKEKVKIASSD